MSDHPASKSESIWIGLCVLLLVLLAVGAGIAWIEARRVADAKAEAERLRMESVFKELENRRNHWGPPSPPLTKSADSPKPGH